MAHVGSHAAARAGAMTLLAMALLISARTDANAITVNDCLAAKLTALGKASTQRTKCAKRFTADNDSLRLAECLAAAQVKMTSFEKAESKYPMASPMPCLTYDDTAAAGQLADELGAELPLEKSNHATPGDPSRCDAARVKCYGKYVAASLSCYADAARGSGDVDSACEEAVYVRMEECLNKAGAKGGCTPPNIGASVARPAFRYGLRRALCLLDESEAPGGCPACQSDLAEACWFLGADGQSCTGVCTDNERVYDDITQSFAGSGGDLAACTVLAEELDIPFTLSGQGSCTPNALGCHWFPADDVVGQCTSPPTTEGAALAGARRICACE